MTRDEQEMALWVAFASDTGYISADAAVDAFRLRYPPQPTAPPAVWYDEPPFAKDGVVHCCWVEGCNDPQSVFWSIGRREWKHFACNTAINRLAGRRVSPITKPPEPTP